MYVRAISVDSAPCSIRYFTIESVELSRPIKRTRIAVVYVRAVLKHSVYAFERIIRGFAFGNEHVAERLCPFFVELSLLIHYFTLLCFR